MRQNTLGAKLMRCVAVASSAALYFVSTKEKTVRAGIAPGTAVLQASF